jgi:nucleoid-associated protein YgaU
MGLITLRINERHAESQHPQPTEGGAVTSSRPVFTPSEAPSAQRDYAGQPLVPGSRLPDRQGSDAERAPVAYTVQRGDTLRGIADWFYGDRDRSQALYAANRSTIGDPGDLEPGTILRIPREGGAKPLA